MHVVCMFSHIHSPLMEPDTMPILSRWPKWQSSLRWSSWNRDGVCTGSRTRSRSFLVGPQHVAISRRMLGCRNTDRLSISCTSSSAVVHLDLMTCTRTVTSELCHCACRHLHPSPATLEPNLLCRNRVNNILRLNSSPCSH